MTKYNFLHELERWLSKLPVEDKKEIMQDYEEHFEFALEAGKSDEEVIASLGSPEKIARELLADYHVELARETKGFANALRALFAVAGLGFFNLVFVLTPAIMIGSVIFAIGFSGIMFIAIPILLLFLNIVGLQAFTWFEFFMSLAIGGVGILLSIVGYYMAKWAISWTIRYLVFNLRIVKGDK